MDFVVDSSVISFTLLVVTCQPLSSQSLVVLEKSTPSSYLITFVVRVGRKYSTCSQVSYQTVTICNLERIVSDG